MARDEYLFNLCQQKKMGIVRLYGWESPSFSFGVSQKISKAIDPDVIKKNNADFVRRITGGKTVLHDDEITYAVISSEDLFYKDNDLYKSYMLISEVLVDAFRHVSVNAVLSAGSPPGLSRSDNPCFSFPTPNEIEVDGKKIVGSAQKRNNKALLQHGSIPVSMNYDLYAAGARSRPAILQRSMTTLSEVSKISKSQMIKALEAAFQNFVGQELMPLEFNSDDISQINEIQKKYLSSEWNYIL